ncbi:hypothetical protein E2L08_10170 [Palleronia sediminis]|uniref:Transmembrane protein n=1 Tax=Palleronia sediminis TaxID=2547833 RepID=A0A4R6A6M9_9RHOB|nr:hypothetical protein [Palleronia sediminis]TDL79381.1 hypothetical protein E2L08_10170 [Palleronia sediminis]
MLASILYRLKFKAQFIARKTIWGTVAGIFLLAAAAFFIAALVISLAAAFSPLAATLIMGSVMALIGVIALGVARLPPRVRPPAVPPTAPPDPNTALIMTAASVLNALILGMNAGRSVRRRDPFPPEDPYVRRAAPRGRRRF